MTDNRHNWHKLAGTTPLVVALLFLSTLASAIEPKEIVLKSDEYRQPFREMKIVSRLTSFRDNKMAKEGFYDVFIKGDRALVVVMRGAEKGQKVLMLNGSFWMRFPSSGRAIRITPMQRLMGDASYGDLGKISWSNDYKAVFHPEGKESKVGESPALRLLLTSRTTSATYDKIELWVDKHNYQPLQADYYLSSGKHFKRALFGTPRQKNGRPIIMETTFVDILNTKNRTIMEFEDIKETRIDDRLFNLTLFSDK